MGLAEALRIGFTRMSCCRGRHRGAMSTSKLFVNIKLKVFVIIRILGWDKNPDKKGSFEGNRIIYY